MRFDELIDEIKLLIIEHDLADKVVFHGTSTHCADDIEKSGLRPTSVDEAYFNEQVDFGLPGSGRMGTFWGQVTTAAWYAKDTVIYRHEGSEPRLIVADVYQLAARYPIYADRASLEGAVDPLMPISMDAVANEWWDRGEAFSWERGLAEIGAVFAVHDEYLDDELFRIIETADDLRNYLSERTLLHEQTLSV